MTDPTPPQWERAVLERVALKALDEQRRARQWGALFKLLWFILAFTIVAAWLGWIGRPDKETIAAGGKHTAVVDLEGVIAPEGKASAERVIRGLDALRRNGVEWNALTTVNAANADHRREVYTFLRDELGATFVQLIPIVERVTPELLPLAESGWGARKIDV